MLQCVSVRCSVLPWVTMSCSVLHHYENNNISIIREAGRWGLAVERERRGSGWRRRIGRLQLQVSFRKRTTEYRALLWKMTTKIRHPMHTRHPVSLAFPASMRSPSDSRKRERQTQSQMCETVFHVKYTYICNIHKLEIDTSTYV